MSTVKMCSKSILEASVNHIVEVSLIERVQIMPNQTDVSKGCTSLTRSPPQAQAYSECPT